MGDYASIPKSVSICLCTRFAPAVGGIETLAETLAHQWVQLGNHVEIVTDVNAANGTMSHWPFAVHRNPSAREFLAMVRRCDVLVHLNISLKLLWPAAVARRPFVASHQSWYCTRQHLDNRREKFKRWVTRKAAANISCSREVRDALGCGGEVIGNPYDDQRFRDLNLSRTGDLVFVGRLVSDKGVDVLLRALAQLAARGVRPTLSMVGDGPERATLDAMVDDLDLRKQVEFLGNQTHDALPAIMNRHRVLVVPSMWDEPFGIVALEGAACGCVVVGSSGGGLPEAIGPCGVTFPNGDDKRLAETLADVLADQSRLDAYRVGAPEHLAKHRADVVAEQYLEVFRRAIRQ